ncbi:RHS repeat-associated core domain-containing protein [Streptomyces violaceochromogenes]|uniref:RHS repeat-associated core domain-containing protein n=1 Tax=Streptomyces violaceochromogenes TaxID=67377 RepID=A0ABU6LZ34_9ACTN|nr:RHS repeat-associated core domain-containing protein [Streptomyces violaceochromogenes]MEC7054778.1 RHS repeat-associated core domain-containing protein [Streptomyces violaceochromogenes]
MPAVKVGENRPVKSVPSTNPTDEVFLPWHREQRERVGRPANQTPGGKQEAPRGAAGDGAVAGSVPEGQGNVPWHRYTSFAITDALTAKIDYSTGNLMLTATDFDIAGVGQRLRLARTYNSLDAPWGRVSQRWWQQYERYLSLSSTEAVFYDASGATVRFTKNSDGAFTTPKGYSQDLKKNADGTYTLTRWKSGAKETYNQYGTLTKITDRNKGTITVTQHDENGQNKGFKLTETRSGRFIDLVKTDSSQWQAKDNTGRTAVYDLDADGNLATTTDTEGKTVTFRYDSSGRIDKITTAEGRVTLFRYDDVNRVTSMLRGTGFHSDGHTGPTWTYGYTAASPSAAGTTTATDPEMHATKYAHDGDGRVTEVTDALGRKRSTKFDANNNIDSTTDAMGSGTTPGNVTDYGFNARNNLETVTMPTGGKTVNTWQTIAGGDVPKDSTNPDGEKTSFTYDTAGNTASVAQTGTGGGSVSFDYNPATPTCGGFEGQRCKAKTKITSTKTVITDFHYDPKGNLEWVKPPAPLDKTTFTYDDLGRTKTVTDARGITVTYTYDHLDRIRTVTSPNTVKVEYGYDGDGNLVQRSDGTGTTKYEFDPLQRETIRHLQDGSQTLLDYTPAGNVDYYQDPAGKVDYSWNEVNKLSELKDPQGRVTTYKYNNNDVRTKTTYPGGTVQEVGVDNSSRPKSIKATSSQGTLVDLAYTYGYGTNAANDGTKVRTSTDNVRGTKRTYTYDGAGRFSYAKEEKGSAIADSWQYCYDLAGNLTSQGTEQGCPRGTTYTYNDAQQLTGKSSTTGVWSYDAIGNETAGASTDDYARTGEKWTDHSQMSSITVAGRTHAGQYGSTDQSERIRLGDTLFHNGPLGLSAKTTAGVDMGFNREPGGTLNSMTTGGKTYYYLTDAIGSVVALADADGNKVNTYAYSPRGVRILAQTSEPVAQPHRFAGGYQDPTGLYHFQARYYDPNIGRFTQPDPSGQEKNPYLYAEGDPVNRIDPTGTLSLGEVMDTVGKAGDAIAVGEFAGQLATGDYKGAAGTAISFAADKAFTAGCTYLTGGAGAIPCAVGGMAVGEATETAYEDATS